MENTALTRGTDFEIVEIFTDIESYNEDLCNYLNQQIFFMGYWIDDMAANSTGIRRIYFYSNIFNHFNQILLFSGKTHCAIFNKRTNYINYTI